MGSEIGSAQGTALYGDNMECYHYDTSAPYKDDDGIWMIKVCIAPTLLMRQRYKEKIKDSLLTEKFKDGRHGLWIEYRKASVRPLKSNYPSRLFITSNVDGTKSKYELMYEEKDRELEVLENAVFNRDITISNLLDDVITWRSRAEEYARKIAKIALPLQDKNVAMNPPQKNDEEVI
jgi:hypothetical protein